MAARSPRHQHPFGMRRENRILYASSAVKDSIELKSGQSARGLLSKVRTRRRVPEMQCAAEIR
jgi:hypothetical protein